ncbi:hypothetical protein LX32DRAFT_304252 [Colletotrichum zoysiae]|uniref:Uncharacterized protein n=1 Tax=Colletotrichum zoysiae TaxID=1216348 RepID=A0AAD9LW98_9PEZI|nr:hypothetical protein LX32DRAFT_304252 [Colletotrichum zoysiae]
MWISARPTDVAAAYLAFPGNASRKNRVRGHWLSTPWWGFFFFFIYGGFFDKRKVCNHCSFRLSSWQTISGRGGRVGDFSFPSQILDSGAGASERKTLRYARRWVSQLSAFVLELWLCPPPPPDGGTSGPWGDREGRKMSASESTSAFRRLGCAPPPHGRKTGELRGGRLRLTPGGSRCGMQTARNGRPPGERR